MYEAPNYQCNIVGSVQAWPATILLKHVHFWGTKSICMYFIIFCSSFLSPKHVRNTLPIWCHVWFIPPVSMFHLIFPPIICTVYTLYIVKTNLWSHFVSAHKTGKSRKFNPTLKIFLVSKRWISGWPRSPPHPQSVAWNIWIHELYHR